MKRNLLRRAFLPVLALLFLVFLTAPGLLAVPITLLIGWWSSAARLIQGLHPSSIGVALFVGALISLVAGTHRFLNWTYAAAEGGPPNRWRWKWTLCGFGVIACTLFAICSMVLSTHQVYWISKSSDPLFASPIRERVQVLLLAEDFRKQAEESQWNTAHLREYFHRNDLGGSRQSAAEAIRTVWLEKDESSLRAVILVPRHPLNRDTARLAVLQPGTSATTHRLDELPQVLASLNAAPAELSNGATPLR